MAIKKIEVRVCDKCQRELVGRLTYRVCPCCNAEVCLECLEKANKKLMHREKKQEQVSTPPAEGSTETIEPHINLHEVATAGTDEFHTLEPATLEPKKRGSKKAARNQAQKETPMPEKALDLPDISTFSVSVGQDGKPHTLKLGKVAITSGTLRNGVIELLAALEIDQKYVESAAPSEGKDLLLTILKEVEHK